jgi:dihydroxyacetone kinase-like protein
MDAARQKQLIAGVANAIVSHAGELTALDQAIGDGDHGVNMKRGFEAVLADADRLAAKPLPEMLFGTLFIALAKEIPADPTLGEVAHALGQAIEAVKARGKSAVGQKTMLDVLDPVLAELAGADRLDLAARLKARAAAAARATVPMKAIRGRASYLGDRSIGHMDPGGRSVWLIVDAVCDTLASPAQERS